MNVLYLNILLVLISIAILRIYDQYRDYKKTLGKEKKHRSISWKKWGIIGLIVYSVLLYGYILLTHHSA